MQIAVLDFQPVCPVANSGGEFFCQKLGAVDPNALGPGRNVLVAGRQAPQTASRIRLVTESDTHFLNFGDNSENGVRSNGDDSLYDLADLPYQDSCFDSIFINHGLEQLSDTQAGLFELSRVLKPDGWILLAFHNRYRIANGLPEGLHSNSIRTWLERQQQNLRMNMARMARRFRRPRYPHAGYSHREMSQLLLSDFADQWWVTRDFLQFRNRHRQFSFTSLLSAGRTLRNLIAPSLYVFARNGK